MMENVLIPFGKYKGQPVEAIKNDKQYLDWLTAQDWFRSGYPQINTLIINNFNQPSDTPEHNAMVAMFLDGGFCSKVFGNRSSSITLHHVRLPHTKSRYSGNEYYQNIFRGIVGVFTINEIKYKCDFEDKLGSDVSVKCDIFGVVNFEDKCFNKDYIKDFEDCAYKLNEDGSISEVTFATENFFLVECKPVMSDDFPSIIRQCRNQKSDTLLIGKYTGVGSSLAQVREMFKDIEIVSLEEIKQLKLNN